LAALRNYLRDPKIGLGILDNTDVLSVHAWDNPKRRDRFLELDALFDDLRRLGRKPELAITEYGLARPEPTDSSDRMNVKMRSRDNVANTSFFGSISARDLLRFYASGVGTIIHWEFRDESWGKASFGLLDETGNERPINDARDFRTPRGRRAKTHRPDYGKQCLCGTSARTRCPLERKSRRQRLGYRFRRWDTTYGEIIGNPAPMPRQRRPVGFRRAAMESREHDDRKTLIELI
jgi:hypothetical protein